MQFEATRKWGNRVIKKTIHADNLNQAEKIANKTYHNWEDIRIKDGHRQAFLGDCADELV